MHNLLWSLAVITDILVVVVLLLGAVLLWTRRQRIGRIMVATIAVWLTVLTFTPLPLFMALKLENRFPQIAPVPQDVEGILILGTGFDRRVVASRGVPGYIESIGRLIDAVPLIQKNPQIPVYFTGQGIDIKGAPSEAQLARQFFAAMGVTPGRIIYEDKARDTLENARNLAAHLHPKPHQKWLLVTSAFHMPRAVGLMRKAGFHVVPYPVDYHMKTSYSWHEKWSLSLKLKYWRVALHEWAAMGLGLLTGVSGDFFPAPE
ncbi:MAG: YdcF family protein [Holosporales bacterium]